MTVNGATVPRARLASVTHPMTRILAFASILVFIVGGLIIGDQAFSGSDDAPSPTQVPTLTAAEAAVAKGSIQAVHLIPAPADPAAFLLAIDPPNGVAGPGPSRTAIDVPLGEHVVSLIEIPGANHAGTPILDSVACQSDRRVPVTVQQALSVTVKLTLPGEKITCVFQSSLVSSTRQPGPTP